MSWSCLEHSTEFASSALATDSAETAQPQKSPPQSRSPLQTSPAATQCFQDDTATIALSPLLMIARSRLCPRDHSGRHEKMNPPLELLELAAGHSLATNSLPHHPSIAGPLGSCWDAPDNFWPQCPLLISKWPRSPPMWSPTAPSTIKHSDKPTIQSSVFAVLLQPDRSFLEVYLYTFTSSGKSTNWPSNTAASLLLDRTCSGDFTDNGVRPTAPLTTSPQNPSSVSGSSLCFHPPRWPPSQLPNWWPTTCSPLPLPILRIAVNLNCKMIIFTHDSI